MGVQDKSLHVSVCLFVLGRQVVSGASTVPSIALGLVVV